MAVNFNPTNPNRIGGTNYNAPTGNYYIPDYGPDASLAGNGDSSSSSNPLQSVLSFLGTPGGAAVTNLVGGGLSAYGQYQQNQQNLKQNALQFGATALQNQYNADRQLAATRAAGVLSGDPLGADQTFAQKNALKDAILKAGPARSGDPAIPQGKGGATAAWANFDPKMADALFGPQATSASIAQRHNELNNLDPNAPTASGVLSSMYGDQAKPYMDQMDQWATQAQNMDAQQKAQFQQQLQGYINQMLQQEQDSGGGFWHTLAKIAGGVAGVAAGIMTGGAGFALMPALIGAAGGAASAWGSGGNPLMGAIMGGVMPAAGKAIGGALKGAMAGGA